MVEDRPIDDGNHSGLPDGDEDRLRFQTLWIILSAKPPSSPGETTVSGLYRGPARHLLTRVRLVGVIGYQLNTDWWYRILRVNGLFAGRNARIRFEERIPTSRVGHVVQGPVWKSSQPVRPRYRRNRLVQTEQAGRSDLFFPPWWLYDLPKRPD